MHLKSLLAVTCLAIVSHARAAQHSGHRFTGAAAQTIEDSYWRSRSAAELNWRMRVPGASVGTLLSIPGKQFVRFWDLYLPHYNCPYIRVCANLQRFHNPCSAHPVSVCRLAPREGAHRRRRRRRQMGLWTIQSTLVAAKNVHRVLVRIQRRGGF